MLIKILGRLYYLHPCNIAIVILQGVICLLIHRCIWDIDITQKALHIMQILIC